LAPVRTISPVPVCCTEPVPEMMPLKIAVVDRAKASVALLTMLPLSEPLVPAPICRVPPLIVVPPV
jgi:hypothetical protein